VLQPRRYFAWQRQKQEKVCDACYGALTGMLGEKVEILQVVNCKDQDKNEVVKEGTEK